MKTIRILVILVSAVTLTAVTIGCSGSQVSVTHSSSPVSQTSSPHLGVLNPTMAAAVERVQLGVEPSSPVPPIDASEAKAKTGVSLRLPNDTKMAGDVKAIYADTSASGNPQVVVHFSNGLLIAEESWKDKPDFAHEISLDSDPKNAQPLTPGSKWIPTKVAGFEGKLLPQPAVVVNDQEVYNMPPQLQWWDNGVKYWMSAWNLNFTAEQLQEIANSMY